MFDSSSDLAAYQDLGDEVKRVYTAYLDAKLMGFRDSSVDPQSYWRSVRVFRRETLDPIPRPGDVDAAGKALSQSAYAQGFADADKPEFVLAKPFLYWFDARARYWAEHDKPTGLAGLVPTDFLGLIHHEAQALQIKLEAQAALEHGRSRDPVAIPAQTPASALVAKIQADAAVAAGASALTQARGGAQQGPGSQLGPANKPPGKK